MDQALAASRKRLIGELGADGAWAGHLSSSALSTAVAVMALARMDAGAHRELIDKGLNWLAGLANPDGGWGDTVQSPSNLSTTLLCWAAFCQSNDVQHPKTIAFAREWLRQKVGGLDPAAIAAAVTAFYGNDRTFSAPILTVCALAGCFGKDKAVWRLVPQLPFEAALLPHQFFKWVRLPVVSYAIPALIAIGLVRHQYGGPPWSPLYAMRQRIKNRVLRVLEKMQPESGGFLEATPLTGFVTLSLAASGLAAHPVARQGAAFLANSMREEGSWPIDTNLSTWVTTLAVNFLEDGVACIPREKREAIRRWLLEQQHRREHPFTHAAPGGWAWTHCSGGVPDGDDTAGALLALRQLGSPDPQTVEAVQRGLQWLLDLQNRDGGIPTFCRGWGRLPFDRSCPDITAHALRAFSAWQDQANPEQQQRIPAAIARGIQYLGEAQQKDGSWRPLWFGSQLAADHLNPTYGTAQVVLALRRLRPSDPATIDKLLEGGCRWLLKCQNPEGSWGGAPGLCPSIEETALALSALAEGAAEDKALALEKGVLWLLSNTAEGTNFPPAPIGLYFASLWYAEASYPLVFTVGALSRVSERIQPSLRLAG